MSQPIVAAIQMTSARRCREESRHRAAAAAAGPRRRRLPRRAAGEFLLHGAQRSGAPRDRRGRRRRHRAETIAAAARELGLWIVAGTQPIAVPGDSRPANACVVYDAGGRRAARYDKIHLFDVDLPSGREGYRESANAVPGAQAVTVDTPAGRLGLSVCYDLRFPELYPPPGLRGSRNLQRAIRIHRPTGRAHWEVLLRARAIEDLSFVIAAAQSGIPRQRPRDLRRQPGHRLLGPRARAPAARHRRRARRASTANGQAATRAEFPGAETPGDRLSA